MRKLQPTFDGSRADFLRFALELDDLAYIRRAQGVQTAWQQLVARSRAQRNELISMARMRLALLDALIDHQWSRLAASLISPGDAAILEEYFRQWQPVLRATIFPSESTPKIRRALERLIASFERFNRHWQRHLKDLDLNEINRLRADYNRYYVIEKACAFQSEQIALEGFEPLAPVTAGDLLAEFPLLEVPRMK